MTRTARVKLNGKLVGHLSEEGPTTRFTYTQEWLASPGALPVSLTLPLRPEPYLHSGLHPFFENLLPEGWLFDIASKKLKISKDDPIGMLLATCGDCIGNVEIEPVESMPDGLANELQVNP